MPIGATNWNPGGVDPHNLVVPVHAADLPPAAPDLLERHVGDQAYYDHRTLTPTGAWPARIVWSAPVHRLVIFAPLDVPLVMSFDRAVSTVPGGYDEFHPGGGVAVIVCRAHTELRIATWAGGAPSPGQGSPSDRVEVTAHGGAYALRP